MAIEEKITIKPIAREQGFVLILSMVILLILSIVVISVNSTTLAQEKMIAAAKQANLALEAAENALRIGEQQLKNIEIDTLVELIESAKVIQKGEFVGSLFEDDTWSSNENLIQSIDLLGEENSGVRAKFFIEQVGDVIDDNNFQPDENTNNLGVLLPKTHGFRIVARGEFISGDERLAQRVLVSYFARKF